MKIVYLVHSLTGAGTTRQAALICEELHRLGMDVTLLVGSRIGVNASEFDQVAYPVHYLSSKPMGYSRFVWKLAGYLRRNPECLLLSGAKKVNIKAIDAHRLVRHKGPLILTLTNNIAQYNTQTSTAKTVSLRKHYRKYQFADKIIVISRAMESELLANGFEHDQLFFCPPPIDITAIKGEASLPVAHDWLQTSKGKRDFPVILSAGRYDPQKNFPLLLKAFALACAKRPMRLIVLGSGDAQKLSAYKTLAKALGIEQDVDFAGFQANPFAYMANVDLFALSSDWEGFGLVLAEALVCGVPVLSTNCPHGPAEIMEGTSQTALTPIGDPVAMSEAVLKLLSPHCTDCQSNIEAMKRYDKAIIGQNYKSLLESFVDFSD